MVNEIKHTPYEVEDSSNKRSRYAYDVVCNGRSYDRCQTIEDANKVADAFNNAKALLEACRAALEELYRVSPSRAAPIVRAAIQKATT